MQLLVIGTVASITFKFSDADVSPHFRKTKGTHLIYFVTNKGYSSLKLSILLQVYILQRIKTQEKPNQSGGNSLCPHRDMPQS